MSTALPTRGRLIFDSGAAHLTITSSASLEGLYQAEFEGEQPEITVQDGDLHIRYPRFPSRGWLRSAFDRRSAGRLTLNATIPWDIELHGGLADLRGDFRELQVRSFHLHGGASGLTLDLGTPEGQVPIEVHGGMSRLTIHRPATVPTSLHMAGGTAALRFDDQSFGAMGGQFNMHSHGDASASGSYAIEIAGGAANIAITAV